MKLSKIIFLLGLLIYTSKLYSSPPPLPQTSQTPDKIEPEKIVDKIQGFLNQSENNATLSTSNEDKQKDSKEQLDTSEIENGKPESFIDLGNTTLPTVEDNSFNTLDNALEAESNNVQTKPGVAPKNILPNLNTTIPSIPVAPPISMLPSTPPTLSEHPVTHLPSDPIENAVFNQEESTAIQDEESTKSTVLKKNNTEALPQITPIPAKTSVPKVSIPPETISSPQSDSIDSWNIPLQPVEVISNKTPILTPAVPQKQDNPPTKQQEQKIKVVDSKPTNIISQEKQTIVNKETNTSEISAAAKKFVEDEIQMLFLPDDEIVLGKLTEQTKLDQMDIYAYIKLFQKHEQRITNSKRRKQVQNLIKYDSNIDRNKLNYSNLSYSNTVSNAFKAISKNNLFSLRTLLDSYPILQTKKQNTDTLLTTAVYNDNYYLVKFLLMRGIQIPPFNAEYQNIMDVTLITGNNNITCMLTKAIGGKKPIFESPCHSYNKR